MINTQHAMTDPEAESEAPRRFGSVYRDLLDWSSELPNWQNELLRRVLDQKQLGDDEVEELAQAAVAEFEQQPSRFSRLSDSDVPAAVDEDAQVTLVAIRNLRNVNALRDDQELTFGPQMTVVFGENASGKSGYSRVLKQVYRARVVEDILPDLRADTVQTGKPSAEFAVQQGDSAVESIQWAGDGRSEGLGRFAVLDSSCSRTYVSGGELAVGPEGIDVPRRFAEELDRVKRRLEARVERPSKASLKMLENATATGQFVKSLSAATTDEALAAAAEFGAEQEEELRRSRERVAAARAQSPSQRRRKLNGRLTVLASSERRFAAWSLALGDESVRQLEASLRALDDAERALHGAQDIGDDAVPSTVVSSSVWRDMILACLEYVESASEDSETLGVDGRCVLCWQELSKPALQRLDAFIEFIRGKAEESRREAVRGIETLAARVKEIPTELPEELVAMSAVEGEMLAQAVNSTHDSIVARRAAALGLLESRDIRPTFPTVDDAFEEAAGAAAKGLTQELESLPETDAEANAEIRELDERILDLETRKQLNASRDDARKFVHGTRDYQRHAAAANEINTRAASLKARKIHDRHMTVRYQELVDGELGDLRFRRPKPVLYQKTNKGRVQVAPIVSAELKSLPPDRVFSEGERTAISLASFLAELRLGDDPAGLIFDDPVSSLDHNFRERVAARLVAAAEQRQVIVFTHSIAFLVELREQAKLRGVQADCRTLMSTDFDAGFVEGEEPFAARGVSKRIGSLKNLLVRAEKAAKTGELTDFRVHARDFYDRLRSTWERFVEERMFAKVVQRIR